MAVHGDDFTFCGYEDDLIWVRDLMRSWFEVKVRGILGRDKKDLKEIVLLGRILRVCDWGFEFEADPKHREMVLKHFEVLRCRNAIQIIVFF